MSLRISALLSRVDALMSIELAVALAVGLPAVIVMGQTPAPRAAPPASATAATPFVMPRAADGHPDLQGMYDIATLTPVERPAGQPLNLSKEQADRLEQQVATRRARGRQPSRTDRVAPPVGGDGSTGAAGGVGGYNGFWIDAGDRYVVIDGLRRTSIVVDPIDGHIPAGHRRSPPAQRREAYAHVRRRGEFRRHRGGRVRQPRAAAARRALHPRIRPDGRAAGSARLLLQQPAPDRADAAIPC